MRKRLRIVSATLLFAALAGFAWSILHRGESEPIVDSKPLSSWVSYFTTGHSELAEQAVDKVGTNAIPILLRMLRRTDSPLKRKVMELAQKQHIIPVHYISAEQQNQAAYFAFLRLGTRANTAVPALMEIYELRLSPFSRQCAAGSVSVLGPVANVAVPVLIRGMSDTNTLVRCDTLLALSRLEPDLVVSTLTNALSAPESKVRHFACQALSVLGSRKDLAKARSSGDPWVRQAVAALIKSLSDPDQYVRGEAAGALRELDPAAAVKAGVP